MLSIRLPKDLEQELDTISKLQQTTKTEIVKDAIKLFLENLKHKRKDTPYTLGEDLFGVYEGEKNSSLNYKEKLDEILNEKYSNH